MTSFAPTSVIVLFGGDSHERLVSVASAQNLALVLPDARFWFWTEEDLVGEVSRNDLREHRDPFTVPFRPRTFQRIGALSDALDTLRGQPVSLFLAVHGGSGENGTLQAALETRRLAFTGSDSLACAAAMDKPRAKQIVRPLGIKLAEQLDFTVTTTGALENLRAFQKQYGRIVLKPADEGSSVGLAFVSTLAEVDSWWAVHSESKTRWLAEEFLVGRELTIGVAMHRGSLLVLPPSEVILERNARFDYTGKYLGVGNREITPAQLSPRQTSGVQQTAVIAHTALGCYGYTRSEVFLTERGVYFLETNTLPGITQASFIPQQLRAAGIPFEEFVHGQCELALHRYE